MREEGQKLKASEWRSSTNLEAVFIPIPPGTRGPTPFIAYAVQGWLKASGIKTLYIKPGGTLARRMGLVWFVLSGNVSCVWRFAAMERSGVAKAAKRLRPRLLCFARPVGSHAALSHGLVSSGRYTSHGVRPPRALWGLSRL